MSRLRPLGSTVIVNVRGISTADNSLGLFDSSEKLNTIENQLDVCDNSEKLNTVEDQSDADETENGLLIIRKLKNRYINNPILAHLSINSLRYKIKVLREILSSSQTDFLSISETKIDASFPNAHFRLIAVSLLYVIVIKMMGAFLPLLRTDCYPIENMNLSHQLLVD